ncbi:hypothetical protein [Puniceibacterium sp. IMCC21224]|uniref:hypothetical protein n=1 Tax=Puniceibacterium sp. IMCC21224 TaxID=1618204 RepID=UPI00064E077B|nr:hypothetical protein [Puniceibacterium sp. IMCC21224]KMK65188.1 hypothetical protein IMCC21224_1118 [Puniceibacterium sp. IMCC21224]
MADRALTEEAVRSGLRDIRLPMEAAGGLAADLLAALAIGLLCAVFLGLLARFVTLSRPKASRTSLKREVTSLEVLPDDAQRIALLHLLKARAPERYRALVGEIYRPGGMPELVALRAQVLAHD